MSDSLHPGEHTMIFKRSKQTSPDIHGGHNSTPTLIAHDVTVEGNVTTTGELHIDGTVYGVVRARSCVIDMNGYVHGEIIAEDIFIRGKVVGPIRGTHVNLYAGAQVEGDILNETISIENGANIYGMISRAEVPIAGLQTQQHENGQDRFAHSPALSFGQDNYFDQTRDETYRPIKVVRPR
jgi:cytoskeletal protein CcmA (bactofilin family)